MTEWTLARGYRFAGVHCGLRPEADRRDLALIVSERPAAFNHVVGEFLASLLYD